jgi:hypothetical protein
MLVSALESCGDPWVVEELTRLVASGSQPEARQAASLLDKHEQFVRW